MTTNTSFKNVTQTPIVPVMTVGELIACGQYGSANKVVHKMGYNASISGTTQEDIWWPGGDYVFPPAASYPGAKMEVVSTADEDDGDPAGTGANTVTIGYLDGSGVEKTETVTLNGKTAVATTAADIWRVNSFRVASAGTGLKAAGTISLRELDDSPVFSQIGVGQTRARNMAYTVPAGKMLMIREISVSSTAASVDKAFLKFTLRANCNNGTRTAVGLEYPLWGGAVAGTGWQIAFVEPIYVPAMVDTHVVAVGNAASDAASATCEWRGCLLEVPA